MRPETLILLCNSHKLVINKTRVVSNAKKQTKDYCFIQYLLPALKLSLSNPDNLQS